MLATERDDRGVVTLTMDRPEVRNAFDADLIRLLRDTFAALSDDEDIRVVVLTGAGDVFSAGADLTWMRSMVNYDFNDNAADSQALHDMLAAIHDCPHPVVARVNGHAIGGGAGIVACVDVVVAVDTARFGFTEVRLGLAPAVISPFVLERIGTGHARRLFLTGELFDAASAHRIGLVDVVTGAEELDDGVEAVIGDLLRAGPQAQAAVKRLLPRVLAATDVAEAADTTVQTIATLRVSDEGQEGTRAFLEKRDPRWLT